MPDGPIDPKEIGRLYALSQVGLEMAVPIVAGLGVDHWFQCSPWGVVGGAVFGFAGGIIHLIVLLNQQNDGSSGGRKRN